MVPKLVIIVREGILLKEIKSFFHLSMGCAFLTALSPQDVEGWFKFYIKIVTALDFFLPSQGRHCSCLSITRRDSARLESYGWSLSQRESAHLLSFPRCSAPCKSESWALSSHTLPSWDRQRTGGENLEISKNCLFQYMLYNSINNNKKKEQKQKPMGLLWAPFI